MPGGLNEVTQQVGADASRYISEYRAALAVTKELSAANKELAQARAMAGAVAGAAAGGSGLGAIAGDVARMNAEIRAGLSLARDFGAAHAAAAAQVSAASAAIRDVAGSAGDMTARFEAARASIGAMAADAQAQSERIVAGFQRGSAQVRVFSTDVAGLRSSASDTAAAIDSVSRSIDVLQAKASGAGSSSIGVLGPALAAAMGSGGGGGGGTTDAATAAIIARNLAARGYGPTPGSTSPVDTALAALLGGAAGGAGGGGGGGGGAAPSFIPWAGGGFQAVRFWGMMGAEIASTVVPAVVAAGSAAVVGAQGFEQLQNRAQAVYTVSEALGQSLGKTAGQFFGGGNALQRAQDAAGGGVYELAGAGINLLKSGAGGGFLQQGTSTLAMLDRSAANISPNLGQRIAGLMGGGTGYLQQFGSVGANLGNTLLNVAPNLAGVGPMLLGGVQGATGLASTLSRDIPGPLQKELFTYEAASRWLPAILGGSGLIGRMLGLRGVGGLGGLLGKGGEALFARGAGGILGDIGLGAIGAGDTLAALTGPETGGLSVALQGLIELSKTMPTRSQRTVAGLQAGISQAGFTSAWQPLGKAITTTTGLAAGVPAGWQSNIPTGETTGELGRFGPTVGGPTTAQVYQNAAAGFSQQMANLIGAGPQLQAALSKAGLKGASMADAFQIAQNSLLDLSHAFDSHGKLTGTAQKMLSNYVAAIGPMTQSGGAFGAAVAGTQIMSSGAMQNLSKVNQAMDSMTQIMSAGPAGMAAQSALLAGLPPNATAKALQSFTSPAGSAAWTAFASTTQPSVISQSQQQMDQLRTALTLGALSQPQAAGLAGFQLQQMLPLAKQSPAALAMIMQQGAQMGVTGYYQGDPSKPGVQAANYAAAVAATAKIADNSKQANAATNAMTVNLANLPATARQFAQSLAPTLQTQGVADAATQTLNLRNAALKGGVDKTALQQFTADLQGAGISGGSAIKQSLGAALQQAGVSKTMQVKIEAQVQVPKVPAPPKGPTVNYPSTVEHPKNPPPTPGGLVHYPSLVTKPVAPPAPAGGTVVYHSIVIGPGASGPIGGTIPGAGGTRIVAGQTGFKVPGFGGGDVWGPAMLEPGELVVPKGMVAAGAVDHLRGTIPGFAAGGLAGVDVPFVTGVGAAFRIAMQETVNDLINALSGVLGQAAAGIRSGGFSSGPGGRLQPLTGGPPPTGTASPPIPVHVASVSPAVSGGGSGGAGGGLPIPAAASKIIDAFEKTFKGMGNPWGKFASQLLDGLTENLKNPSKETAKMAQALVSRVATEVSFGKNLAASTVSGLGLGSMAVTPPTMTAQGKPYQLYIDQANTAAGGQPPSVQGQMSDYLQSIQSFQGDLGKLTKGGLSKGILSQLLSAGPVQGDALAQSILGGQGGIKGANQLYGQINTAANKLGIQGAEAMYGAPLAGKTVKAGASVTGATQVHALQSAINALHGKTVTIHVNLVESGGGSSGGKMSPAQAKQATAQVQKGLLQQAKNNRVTGVKLPGYGS